MQQPAHGAQTEAADVGAGRPPWRSPAPGHAFCLAAAGGGPADMDLGPVTICGEVTVLHGGFLLASSLCHPKPLSELAKSDWPVVGRPIIDALREVCTSYSSYPPQPNAWKKKAAVILWSKILLSEAPSSSASTSVNQRWKDDIFFSVSSMIPEVNHTVLFELFKELNAPRLFTQLLLVLPDPVRQREAATFVQYVAKDTSPADVSFFLDVWWEVLKHREGQEDRMALLFQAVSNQYHPEPDEEGQPAKRFKGDTAVPPRSPPAASVLPIFLEGLKQMKGSIGPARLKCYTLANLVDVLRFVVAPACGAEPLPVQVYLDKVSSIVILWSSDCENQYNGKELEEKVVEAEKSIGSLNGPRLSDESLLGDISFFRALLQEWAPELRAFLGDPQQVSYESYRLLEGLSSLEKKLSSCTKSEELSTQRAQAMLQLRECVADFLKAVDPESWGKNADASLVASVATVIIEKRLERHQEMCSVFASEKSWAFTEDWVSCLVKNKDLFRDPELILKLLETMAAFSPAADSPQSREQEVQVAKVILDCYAALSLPDQNKVISGVLANWGVAGLSALSGTFAEGFQEELNVTFNQIIQSNSSEGLKKAVASVSRLVVLNPEATVKKISNLAVANLGTHQFLAEILCSFPALKFPDCPGSPEASVSLLMGCLKDTVWNRLSSAKEREQFLEFLEYLMQPSGASPLLSPTEVIQNLVLPYLKSDSLRVELCLQVLDKVLKVPLHSEQNWIQKCHPFPLLFCLCKFLDGFNHYWHEPQSQEAYSLETKDLVAANLAQLCDAVLIQKDSISQELWNQSVAWLHKKAAALDWTIGLRLKNVFGEHFKNEAPGTLFEVCKLPEDEWTSRPLSNYGPGSGLLAWLECCTISTALREQMLVLLMVNVDDPEEVNLFSKGFLVALIQVFPWCSQSEWKRLAHVIKSLLEREILYVPYSLEYVQHLPLLNFRPFAYHLRFSVLLLRGFQFLCSSSGCAWLPEEAWKHVARLYCLSVSDLLGTVKDIARGQWHSTEDRNVTRELSFVYIQLFCHTLHVAAMLPDHGTGEPLLLLALEILSHYEMLYDADESLGSALRKANERHFLESITENVTDKEIRRMLRQKLRKL